VLAEFLDDSKFNIKTNQSLAIIDRRSFIVPIIDYTSLLSKLTRSHLNIFIPEMIDCILRRNQQLIGSDQNKISHIAQAKVKVNLTEKYDR
jgi:hypothetical protein